MRTVFLLSFCFIIGLTYGQNKKFKRTKNMKAIQILAGEMEIKIGDKIYYSGNVHGSVGETFSISTSAGLELVDEYFEYDNPKKADMPGGDAATNTFVYQPKRKGEHTVYITEKFRGEIQNKYEVKVKVVD